MHPRILGGRFRRCLRRIDFSRTDTFEFVIFQVTVNVFVLIFVQNTIVCICSAVTIACDHRKMLESRANRSRNAESLARLVVHLSCHPTIGGATYRTTSRYVVQYEQPAIPNRKRSVADRYYVRLCDRSPRLTYGGRRMPRLTVRSVARTRRLVVLSVATIDLTTGRQTPRLILRPVARRHDWPTVKSTIGVTGASCQNADV